MSRIVITGGAGFIGSNLSRSLLSKGHEIVVFDNFSSGLRSNLEDIASDITIVEGDLVDAEGVRAVLEGAHYVLHQAAVPSVPRSVDDPVGSHEANSRGTLNVLMGAADAGVTRVVIAASSSAYGDSPTLPKIETMMPAPKSPYAADKLHSEYLCRVWHDTYGLETVSLRYFNVFGPWQNPKSDYAAAVPRFVAKLLSGDRPVVYGDGLQSRDFTFIDNVVHANEVAMTAPEASGEVFNIGAGARVTINDLILEIAKILGVEANIEHVEERRGDVKHSLASIDKARDQLGYEPSVSWQEGLVPTIEWYRSRLGVGGSA